jgi:hypothetical protein
MTGVRQIHDQPGGQFRKRVRPRDRCFDFLIGVLLQHSRRCHRAVPVGADTLDRLLHRSDAIVVKGRSYPPATIRPRHVLPH